MQMNVIRLDATKVVSDGFDILLQAQTTGAGIQMAAKITSLADDVCGLGCACHNHACDLVVCRHNIVALSIAG